ncbi:hypothetical protein DUI87_22542 [Hirundo rustica rustica]|uniref:Uncharacterized protein n=1 Tax=Hirundo rustica rustica TaxID=333673 RepID=A0A3M0JIN2_HIRRU|nr:hypothetical protein DUI87_22520 [Hirundo rustica rustica]RMC00840.1 hypothetical protein DUI87_22525 [Hirundo rustica rustica]RMC00846.1 hypothetical protein DUI87_22531 [Hirundo rustica rustica]RMC00857.1 hypothetical protein DUI87_22542 [Hirundo rustica rustica]
MVVDTVVDSTVDVARAVAVEVVSRRVLLVGVAVVRAVEVISRVEVRGRAAVVAEVGLVPGAEDTVCARTLGVADGSPVPAVVTSSGMEVSVELDCIVVVAEVFGLEVCSGVEKPVEVVSNGDVSALVEAVVLGGDVDCVVEVENSIVMEVDTVLGSAVEADVEAAVDVVSKEVAMVGVVVRAGEVASGVELLGRAEVVAGVGLVPGAVDDVCARTAEVALVPVPSVVTWSGEDVSGRLDWLGVVAEAFRLELSTVLESIVVVFPSGDVSV